MTAQKTLGIDPGYGRCGWAMLEDTTVIASGCIETNSKDTLAKRYLQIHQELKSIIHTHQPTRLAIEKLYIAKNTPTALQVAEARGVILLTAQLHALSIIEVHPSAVKIAVTSVGNASKAQVMKMVRLLTKHTIATTQITDDELDAIAVAFSVPFEMNTH